MDFSPSLPPPILLPLISLHDNQRESPRRPVKLISLSRFLSVLPFPLCQRISSGSSPLVGLFTQKETAGETQRRLPRYMWTKWSSSHIPLPPHFVFLCVCVSSLWSVWHECPFCCCREEMGHLKELELICPAHTRPVSTNHLCLSQINSSVHISQVSSAIVPVS